MGRAPSKMLRLANNLITQEGVGKSSRAATAFVVCEKLRLHLATLMGDVGFSALLSRALLLATLERPGLAALHVDSGGVLRASKPEAPAGPASGLEGGVTLLAHLLGLLVTYIGEGLTQRLIRDIWPNLRFDRS